MSVIAPCLNRTLVEIADGVYQIRGYDLSHMTLIEGRSGVIVVDPLAPLECAHAELENYRCVRSRRPIAAVVHTDPLAGEDAPHALLDRDGADADTPVIVPDGELGPSADDEAAPTEAGLIAGRLEIDGLAIEFCFGAAAGSPSVFLLYFPDLHLLIASEGLTHTIHNLFTLRHGPAHTAAASWAALDWLLARFGSDIETIVAQHHWPVWGNERVTSLIAAQRDLMRYLLECSGPSTGPIASPMTTSMSESCRALAAT